MSAINLAVLSILTGLSAWQNHFYAFFFGCAALVACSVLYAADRIVREVRDAARAHELHAERTGAQVATAINAGAMSYRKRAI